MTKVKNSIKENKVMSQSIYNAILNIADKGLNQSPQLFKDQVKAVYLQWRLESFRHTELTVVDLDINKDFIQVEDDLFNDEDGNIEVHELTTAALYAVFNEPYVIKEIGEWNADCFATLIEQMYINQPWELAVLCSYAIHNQYLSEIFEANYRAVLMAYTNDRRKSTLPHDDAIQRENSIAITA